MLPAEKNSCEHSTAPLVLIADLQGIHRQLHSPCTLYKGQMAFMQAALQVEAFLAVILCSPYWSSDGGLPLP